MSAGCYLYFSIGNLTQNGKIFNVSNEDILTNARNEKFTIIFHN